MPHLRPAENGILRNKFTFSPEDAFTSFMILGIASIRDCVFSSNEQRREFDAIYDIMLQNLIEAKLAKDEYLAIVEDYNKRINDPTGFYYKNKTIYANEIIDDELNLLFKDFFIRGSMAIKAILKLAKFFDFKKLSFIFGNDDDFEKSSNQFSASNPYAYAREFMEHIRNHRKSWCSTFILFRDKIEHEGYKLPPINFLIDESDKIVAVFPKTKDGREVDELLKLIWENLINFCEDTLMFLFASKLASDKRIVFIPPGKRDLHHPIKYQVELVSLPGVRLSC
ncbi:MAG: hypothetical protein KW793_04660 [Candidatus Doudnabacteria bacterium]|nr:hypothetical protein [Candidatus Doudnabacteria bacterium]